MRRQSWFMRFSKKTARLAGRPVTFGLAVLVIILWALTGPVFNYSDTWQLVINTSTTVVTFLMVFLIQNTQNRDSEAMQIKLDELIRATKGAHNAILDLEQLDEEELLAQHDLYSRLAARAREQLQKGATDDDCPAIPKASGG